MVVVALNISERVTPEDSQKTVYSILKNRLKISSKLLKKLRDNNLIFVNGAPAYTKYRVSEGDVVVAALDGLYDAGNFDLTPEDIDLDIIYEDDCLLAVNKEPGAIIHPTGLHMGGTVANALAYRYQKEGRNARVHPISRLDRNTSGVILFAKDVHISHLFSKMHHERILKKEYVAIVDGFISPSSGEIDIPIKRAPGSIMLRMASVEGQPALTRYRTACISERTATSLMSFYPVTGRTHQIRLHAGAVGNPVISDQLYGNDKYISIIPRHALHSKTICFQHPLTHKDITINAPLPIDMLTALEILGFANTAN
jgi:23S rRNA pseudouridine1911/1915/1917 synthase